MEMKIGKKWMLALLLAASCLHASAQNNFKGYMKKADKEYELFRFHLAIDSYKDAIKERPNDAEALGKLADCYRHLNQMEEAAKQYARALSQKDADILYKLQYAHVLKALGQYDQAKRYYDEYAAKNPVEGKHYSESCNFAKNQQNAQATYTAVAEFVSSTASDFGPAFYGKEQVVFSSARTDIQRVRSDKSGNQLFVAGIGRNGYLEAPYFLKSDLRNAFNDGPLTFSPDGRLVAYTKNNFVDGKRHIASSGMELSIYTAEISNTGDWINEKPFPFNGTNYQVGFPTFSPDGKALYFASNRPDGFGGYDIYVSYQAGNSWTLPENLGPVVNSPGNEVTPFFDGTQLFFSSDWHYGLGGYDIFRAEQANNRWARVFHLGNGVNSPRDDYGFIFDSFRNLGYLTSNRSGGRGNEDIYKVTRSADNIVLKIINAADGNPVANALIDFSDCSEGVFQADAKGVYTFQAVSGLDCSVSVRKDGYLNSYLQLSTAGLRQNREYTITLTRIGDDYLGRVIGYSSRIPVEGVKVIATNQMTTSTMETVTDINGDYVLALSPNTVYVLRYTSPGYRDVNRTVRTTDGIDRNILGIMSIVPSNVNISDNPQNVKNPLDDTTEKGGGIAIPKGFSVQVAALNAPNIDGFSDLKNFGKVYYKNENSKYKIRVGVYADREEALRVLSLVKNQGYKGAFIVNEEGNSETTTDLTKKTGKTTASGNSGKYKVQLAAYSNVKYFDDSKIQGLGTIEERKKGKLIVKYLANFDTLAEARQVLSEAKAAGFKDAYIVEDIGGELKKVN